MDSRHPDHAQTLACAAMPPKLPLRVRVPASTSNLGPGFDLLGLALSLFLEARVTSRAAASTRLVRSGEGAAELLAVEDDLLVHAFEHAAHVLDVRTDDVAFEVDTEIPVGRGFGSSGAAVAAGLLLANALAAAPRSVSELLPLGIELEGHPDNVTASLFGGCTLCHPAPTPSGPVFVRNEVHASIGFVLAWPAEALPTERARAALPPSVPFADAIENPRRLALLLEGLRTGDPELLTLGCEERLHVAHRLPLVAGAEHALAAARSAGAWAATISGAGSGLVALAPLEATGAVADAMQAAFREETGQGSACVVRPVRGIPAVESD